MNGPSHNAGVDAQRGYRQHITQVVAAARERGLDAAPFAARLEHDAHARVSIQRAQPAHQL
jgi:hypothetical protein